MKFTWEQSKAKEIQEGETIETQENSMYNTTEVFRLPNYQWPAILAPDLHFHVLYRLSCDSIQVTRGIWLLIYST